MRTFACLCLFTVGNVVSKLLTAIKDTVITDVIVLKITIMMRVITYLEKRRLLDGHLVAVSISSRCVHARWYLFRVAGCVAFLP